ncbi:MAG TPA: methyltransferase domain-containing protein [Candidatus Acidoferrales bacterium]
MDAPRWVTDDYRQLRPYAHPRTHDRVVGLMSKLPRGRLLECAAGEGGMSLRLQSLGFGVVACDVDPQKFHAAGVRFCRADISRELPFASGSFDYVTCLESIEHLENQFDFMRECARVLRPGGKILITTPNIAGLASRVKFLFTGFYSLVREPLNEFHSLPFHGHIHPLPFYQLRYLLHRSGFRIRYVGTDFYRRSSLAWLWLYPLMRLFTLTTMRREPDPRQREANKEIRKQFSSLALLLGRTQIVLAERLA